MRSGSTLGQLEALHPHNLDARLREHGRDPARQGVDALARAPLVYEAAHDIEDLRRDPILDGRSVVLVALFVHVLLDLQVLCNCCCAAVPAVDALDTASTGL